MDNYSVSSYIIKNKNNIDINCLCSKILNRIKVRDFDSQLKKLEKLLNNNVVNVEIDDCVTCGYIPNMILSNFLSSILCYDIKVDFKKSYYLIVFNNNLNCDDPDSIYTVDMNIDLSGIDDIEIIDVSAFI